MAQDCGDSQASVVLSFAVVLLLGSLPFRGQQTFRLIRGTVRDQCKKPVPGAIVQVEDENNQSIISYIVGQDGQYVFKHLQDDEDHWIWAIFGGRQSKKTLISKFDSHSERTIDLSVKLP